MQELGFIPASILGGESIWVSASNSAQGATDITLDDYSPADGYTLSYSFQSSTPLTVAAVANGDDSGWTLDITGAQTLTLDPCRVPFVGMVTHTESGRTFAVDSGGIVVYASPLRSSSWSTVMTAIDAAMLTVSTNPNGSITVDGMTVTYKSSTDLIKLRDYAKQQYDKDIGRKFPRRILSRFV